MLYREVLHAEALAVGPVEVIAESGSNVNIRNVFNIYLVGDGFSKDALKFVDSESDEEGSQPARVKRGPLIIKHLPRIHRLHAQNSSSNSQPALESSTAVTRAMAAEAGEAKEKEEKVEQIALQQETSSTAAPTSKQSTRAPTAAIQGASTAAVRVSSSKPSSVPRSTSRTSTRAAAGGRNDLLVNRKQRRDQRTPVSRSTATPARSSPTSAARRSLDGSAEVVDLSPEAVADPQPRGRRTTESTPAVKRGVRSAATEAAAGFSGDASVEAVDRSLEALPDQPPQSRQARHTRGQQRDADSEAFVPEHVALSNEDW